MVPPSEQPTIPSGQPKDLSGLAWGGRTGDPEFAPGDRLHDYRLISLLGEGGFGMVYLAEQEQPVKRKVAIKLIKPGMDTRQVVARFEAERQSMALMDHPGVARIYDAAATPAGRPYFVMEFVRGEPLTTYCDTNRLNVAERLRLFVEVCEAVQYAHHKGIIHRDIKPSNVLITTDGPRPLPKVIDWGVAKATQPDEEQARMLVTEVGQFVGTPEYMSPEQAALGPLDVDTRADIYSLGVLLYQLLCGELPLESRDLRRGGYAEIQRAIQHAQALRPSVRLSHSKQRDIIASLRRTTAGTLGRILRDDLDWIVMKAMDKERDRRYASAAELIADIRRHMLSEPVLAGAPSRRYRFRKFVKRHRVPLFAAMLSLVILLGAFAFSMVRWWKEVEARRSAQSSQLSAEQSALALDRQRRRAELAREQAEVARKQAELRAYIRDVAAADLAFEFDPPFAPARLRAARKAAEDAGFSGWELDHLGRKFDRSWKAFTPAGTTATAIAGDGGAFAIAGRAGGVIVIDAAGERIAEHPLASPVERLAIAPGGALLAMLDDRGEVSRRTFPDFVPVGEPLRLPNAPPRLLAMDDSGRLAIVDAAGKAWIAESNRPVVPLPAHAAEITAVTLSAGEVFIADNEGRVLVLGAAGWSTLSPPTLDGSPIRALALSPDGEALAAGAASGAIFLWSRTGTGPFTFMGRLGKHAYETFTLRFMDGSVLVSGGADHRVILWDLRSGGQIAQLSGHQAAVRSLAFNFDRPGAAIVSLDDAGQVLAWQGERIWLDNRGKFLLASRPVAAKLSLDGLFVAGADGRADLIDVDSFQAATAELLNEATGLLWADISPDGSAMAWATPDGRVHLKREQRDPVVLASPAVSSFAGAISPDSRVLAYVEDAIVHLVSVADTQRAPAVELAAPVTCFAWSADARRLLIGLVDGSVVQIDLQERVPRVLAVHEAPVTAIVAAGGSHCVSGDAAGGLIFASTQSTTVPVRRQDASFAVSAITPVGDGSRVVVGFRDGSIRLFHAAEGDEILSLSRADSPVEALVELPRRGLLALRADGNAIAWYYPDAAAGEFEALSESPNLWLTDAFLCDQAGAPIAAIAGEPFAVCITAVIDLDDPRALTAELFVDGESLAAETVPVSAATMESGIAVVRLGPFPALDAGPRRLSVRLRSADPTEPRGDNTFSFWADVAPAGR